MTSAATGGKALRTYLEMIKFEHSIFALPFAMVGMMWGSCASRGTAWPGFQVFALIVIAMVSCRSAAMAYNRIADRDIDAINPRTKMRAIPAGLLELKQVNLFFYASCLIFFIAAALINPLALKLSPFALGITLFYSRTKRFTPLCHIFLGLAMGVAPAAAWIAPSGTLGTPIIWLTVAVLGWGAGFDVIYSLQDEDFDRENNLKSIPVAVGKSRALFISRLLHLLCVVCLTMGGIAFGAGTLYFAGVILVAGLLVFEQSLVKPNDLSRVNMAFFTLNGYVSLGLFAFVLADQLAGCARWVL